MTKDWVTQLKIKILNRDDSEFFYVILFIYLIIFYKKSFNISSFSDCSA